MRKAIIMGLMFMAMATTQAQETKGIQLPAWLGNMKLSGYALTQYQYNGQQGAESNSFNIRMARLVLEGRIAKDFYWKTQIQFNGNTSTLGSSPRMVDLFAEWQKYDFFKVKIGQFKNPFTFENPMNPIDQGFMSYAQNVSKLAGFSDRAGEHASNGRDIGLQLQGDFLKNANGRNLLHYQIGVFNGQGINTKDVDNQKNVIGGIWMMPVKGMRIGAFGWAGSYARKGSWHDNELGETQYEPALDDNGSPKLDEQGNAVMQEKTFSGTRKLSQYRYAFSFEYKVNDWTLRSEYIHSTGKAFAKSINNFNDADAKNCNINGKIGNKAQGVYALAIAPIISKKLYAKARYDMYEPNGKTNMMKTQYEMGLNYNITKNFTILSEYAFVNDRSLADKHNYSMADVEVCFRF